MQEVGGSNPPGSTEGVLVRGPFWAGASARRLAPPSAPSSGGRPPQQTPTREADTQEAAGSPPPWSTGLSVLAAAAARGAIPAVAAVHEANPGLEEAGATPVSPPGPPLGIWRLPWSGWRRRPRTVTGGAVLTRADGRVGRLPRRSSRSVDPHRGDSELPGSPEQPDGYLTPVGDKEFADLAAHPRNDATGWPVPRSGDPAGTW